MECRSDEGVKRACYLETFLSERQIEKILIRYFFFAFGFAGNFFATGFLFVAEAGFFAAGFFLAAGFLTAAVAGFFAAGLRGAGAACLAKSVRIISS